MTSDVLQTSPYLTCVRPNEPPPVVYMTDTRGPQYPVYSDPGGAVFGVIGLDRQVVWQSDPAALAALEYAAADPVPVADLAGRFGATVVADLVARDWLQKPEELCREYRLVSGEIEVTAHCNWGCAFCPVSTDPKPRQTMPMPLFTEIVEKLAGHGGIGYVTFHFFNEPTLDRHFLERLDVLRAHGLPLALYTNGSALTPDKVDRLLETGMLYHLIVNLPTVDESEFAELTRSRTYERARRNLDYSIRAGASPISISVNGIGADGERNVAAVRAEYEPRGVEVYATQVADRAGALAGEYAENVTVTGRLRGCNWPLNHAYFSVRGDLFLCCNDYFQREVYGHVSDGSLREIMSGPAAVTVRRRVFGVDVAPDDYVCRSCHDQKLDFPDRQFRPLATFPLGPVGPSAPADTGCRRGPAVRDA